MTRYGTPAEVRYCSRCTMSNQRPSSVVEWQSEGTRKPSLGFNADGVCAACEYQTIMDTQIDWEARDKELRELCSQARSARGHYDIVVPGSGGKDSTFTAHVLKHRYGMHPLLVTWAPHMLTDVGRRNLERWARIADHVLVTPNREVHRLLTRLAFLNLCHAFQSFVIGQRMVGPRIAQMLHIDLVAYGEPPSMYAGPIEENFTPWMDTRFYSIDRWPGTKEDTLAGVPVSKLRDEHGLTHGDLDAYAPLEGSRIPHVFYLGYFLKWSQQSSYYYAAEHCGFEPNDERTEGSYSKYSSIDDKIDPIHYLTTYAKFGIGRATYDSSQEIRAGLLTREEGVALVQRYDHEVPRRYLAECLEYMGIDEPTFWRTIDAARPEHLWEKREGQWALKSPVWEVGNA